MGDNLIGRQVGKYFIKERIPHNGMAEVYIATSLSGLSEVAVKVLRYTPDQNMEVKRLIREAKIMMELDHPHILRPESYFQSNDLVYIIMPYLKGGSLAKKLKASATLSDKEIFAIMEPLLDAVDYVHDKQLVHRDIKPNNILFDADQNLYLADFGIVKILPDGHNITSMVTPLTDPNTAIGTLAYMAPEQIRGKPICQSDIYSIGVLLYQMLTGQLPFIANNIVELIAQHLAKEPENPCDIKKTISPQLAQIVLKTLEKDAAKRYQTAKELLTALKQAITPEKATTIYERLPIEETMLAPQVKETVPAATAEEAKSVPLPVGEPEPKLPEVKKAKTGSGRSGKPPWYVVVGIVFAVVAVIGGTIFGVASCKPEGPGGSGNITPTAAPPSNVIKIAIDLPLSDTSGLPIAGGARYALSKVSIPGYTIQYDPLDDQSNPNVGKANVTSAINDGLTAAIIGPYNSSVAEQEIPVTNAAPIAQISPANTSPCLTKNISGIGCMFHPNPSQITYFRLPTTDDLEVNVLAKFLRSAPRSYKTAYVVYDSHDLYSNSLYQLFFTAWDNANTGGTVVGLGDVPGNPSVDDYITLLKNPHTDQNPDVVFFAGTMPDAANVKAAMANVPQFSRAAFVAGAGIMLGSFVQAMQHLPPGGPIFTATPFEDNTPAMQQFQNNYFSSIYDQQDGYGPYTASANDCVLIVTQAIKNVLTRGILPPKGPSDIQGAKRFRQAIIDAIRSISGTNIPNLATNFQSFDKNGDNTNPYISIYMLNGNDWKLQESDKA